MNWNTTAKQPPFDRPIIVVHNVDIRGKKELATTTGILKCTDDGKWTILRRGGVTAFHISIGDIHGWCWEYSFAEDAFCKLCKETLEIRCPHCGETTTVLASAERTLYADAIVKFHKLREEVEIGWDDISADFNFVYECMQCKKQIASTIKDLQEIVMKQKNRIEDFTDDADKMLDFFLLSKEQFLETYSYITEEDWDKTLERVRKEWMPNRKKGE